MTIPFKEMTRLVVVVVMMVILVDNGDDGEDHRNDYEAPRAAFISAINTTTD